MSSRRLSALLPAIVLALSAQLRADDIERAREAVLETEGLISFWRFQEDVGARKAEGPHPAELLEGKPGVTRVEGGLFGPYALKLKQGQWLRLPREKLGPLNIHGPRAQVSLVAWVKREAESHWQSVAGVWDETHLGRQYMLFLNAASRTDASKMQRIPSKNRIHGHISASGGASPGQKFWISYASGASEVPLGDWHMVALSYDAAQIRVYLDGKLDAEENFNPFPYTEGIFDGGPQGAEFTVGANHVAGVENNNRFGGTMAGLAVFDRALDEREMARLAAATLPKSQINDN